MRVQFIPLIVAAALAIAALPAAAHHGWAGNGEEEFELTGTVESGVSLAGPHTTMKDQIRRTGLGPHARARRTHRGRRPQGGVIPVGAQVTIHGHRNKDPKKFEVKTERVTWNGKTFNVYPNGR